VKSEEEVNGKEVIFPQVTFTIQAFDTSVKTANQQIKKFYQLFKYFFTRHGEWHINFTLAVGTKY